MSDKITALETTLSTAQSLYDKLDAMTELAWELRYRDPVRSKALTDEALANSDSAALTDDERKLILANNDRNVAHYQYIDVEYAEAISNAERALAVYETYGQLARQMHALAILSNIQMQLGDYVTALQISLRQLEISESADDASAKVDALNRIGVIYSLSGRYAEALEQYALCLPVYEAENNLNGQARIYNNYLIEYQNLKNYEKALEAGQKCLERFEASGNLMGQSRIHGNLVRLYTQLGDYESALRHGERALALCKTLDNKEHQMVNMLYVGQMYTEMEEFGQAIKHIQAALKIAVEMKSATWQYQCHESLAIAYKSKGELEKALAHFEQFHLLKEAVFNDESDTKLRNLEVRYRTRVVQHEAEVYRHRNEELELLREQDRLYFERLSQMKDELLRTASHDLKSPLSTLSMLVYVLKGNPTLDEAGHQLAEQIDHQIERMRDFVIGVLDLAKLETGRALSVEVLPMVHYLKSIVQDFQPLADQKEIALGFAATRDDIMAEFDPIEIRRVVENLLTNAIKYTPAKGHVTLSIDCKDKIIISVSDDGVGIPKESMPHVFDRFYRVNAEAHRTIDGSGLGLAIAKAIVEQHDGEIWVESEMGEGSTFSFSLKAHTSD